MLAMLAIRAAASRLRLFPTLVTPADGSENGAIRFTKMARSRNTLTCSCLTALVVSIGSDQAAAATYYVRPYQPSTYGNGSGTSYDNAWKSLGGVDWNALAAGDTLMICDTHLAGPNPVAGNSRSEQVALGVTKSGNTIDGSCDGHQGSIYAARLLSGTDAVSTGDTNKRIWLGPDAEGVYRTRYDNGYTTDLLCADGQPLTRHVSGDWLNGQFERRWSGGIGTIYYKPQNEGEPVSRREVTLHNGSDCSANKDAGFYVWRDQDGDGVFELASGFLDSRYMLEKDGSGAIRRLNWRNGTLPDASWAAGTTSYVNGTRYYKPFSGTPHDRNVYSANINAVIGVYDASNVTLRNLKLYHRVTLHNADYAVVEQNEFQGDGETFYVAEDSDNGRFVNNEIHNVWCDCGIYFAVGDGNSATSLNDSNNDGWYIGYNHIHDISQRAETCGRILNGEGRWYPNQDRHGIALEGGNNNIIEHNHVHHVGGEGILFYNATIDGRHEQRNNIVRYNYVHDIEDLAWPADPAWPAWPQGCLKVGDTNPSAPPAPFPRCHNERGIELGSDFNIAQPELITGNLVHHNILRNIGTLGFRFKSSWSAETGHTWTVSNNVLLGARQGISYLNYTGTFTPQNAPPYTATYGVQFVNNVVIDAEAAALMTIPPTPTPATAASKNIYYNMDGSAPRFTISGTPGYSLVDWRSQTGLDTNSIAADPQLVGQTSEFRTDLDFRPASVASPVFNAGTSIGLDGDYLGNPIAGPIDIGAFEIQYIDLSITMTDSPDPVLTDGTVTYTITVTNNGPSTATNVSVTGTLPDCTLTSLASGDSATCLQTVTAATAGTLTQNMSVSATEPDLNNANNSASVSTTVQLGCLGKLVTIQGTAGTDVINGTSGADVIHGLGANDTIRGRGGNDTVCGGDGDDIVQGDGGNDALDGGTGADICDGGGGTGDSAANCETVLFVP